MAGNQQREPPLEETLSREELISYFKQAINMLGEEAFNLLRERRRDGGEEGCGGRWEEGRERSPPTSGHHSRSRSRHSHSPERKRRRLEEDNRQMEEDLGRRDSQIRHLKKDLTKAEEREREAKRKEDDARADAKRLKKKLEEMERVHTEDKKEMLKEQESAKNELKVELADMEGKIKNLQADLYSSQNKTFNADLATQDMRQELNTIKNEWAQQKKDYKALKETHEEAQATIQGLERELSESRETEKSGGGIPPDEHHTVTSTEEEKKDSDTQMIKTLMEMVQTQSQQTKEEWEGLSARAREAEMDKFQLTKTNGTLTVKVTQLEGTLEDTRKSLQEEKERVGRRNDIIGKLERDVRNLKAQRGKAPVSPAPTHQSPSMLDDALVLAKDRVIKSHVQRISGQEKELSQCKADMIQLRATLKNTEADRNKWYGEVHEAQVSRMLVQTTKKDLEGKLTQIAKLQADILGLQTEGRKLKQALSSSEDVVKGLRGQESDARSKLNRVTIERDNARKETEEIRQALRKWCTNMKKKDIVILKKELTTRLLPSVQRELREGKQEVAATTLKIVQMWTETKREMEHEFQILRATSTEHKREVEKLEKELEIGRSELKAERAKGEAREKELERDLNKTKQESREGCGLLDELNKRQQEIQEENARLVMQNDSLRRQVRNRSEDAQLPDTTVGISAQQAATDTRVKELTALTQDLTAQNEVLQERIREAERRREAEVGQGLTARVKTEEGEGGSGGVSAELWAAIRSHQFNEAMLRESVRLHEVDCSKLRVQNAHLVYESDVMKHRLKISEARWNKGEKGGQDVAGELAAMGLGSLKSGVPGTSKD